jgi:uncharacterized membrane protein YtjA (UPF0391 family)
VAVGADKGAAHAFRVAGAVRLRPSREAGGGLLNRRQGGSSSFDGFQVKRSGNRIAGPFVSENSCRAKRTSTPCAPAMEESMLYWALMFLIIAIIAGFFGFGGIAVAAAGIAKILFFIFLVIFVVMLLTGLMGRRSPPI